MNNTHFARPITPIVSVNLSKTHACIRILFRWGVALCANEGGVAKNTLHMANARLQGKKQTEKIGQHLHRCRWSISSVLNRPCIHNPSVRPVETCMTTPNVFGSLRKICPFVMTVPTDVILLRTSRAPEAANRTIPASTLATTS